MDKSSTHDYKSEWIRSRPWKFWSFTFKSSFPTTFSFILVEFLSYCFCPSDSFPDRYIICLHCRIATKCYDVILKPASKILWCITFAARDFSFPRPYQFVEQDVLVAGLQIIFRLALVKLSGQVYFCLDISHFWLDKHRLCLVVHVLSSDLNAAGKVECMLQQNQYHIWSFPLLFKNANNIEPLNI